ncbi:MAG: polyprotein [Macrobrachium rosenbergii virus 13]|nr:MAG: polyprotein [Macrobrachium rosenbergii virus 13]
MMASFTEFTRKIFTTNVVKPLTVDADAPASINCFRTHVPFRPHDYDFCEWCYSTTGTMPWWFSDPTETCKYGLCENFREDVDNTTPCLQTHPVTDGGDAMPVRAELCIACHQHASHLAWWVDSKERYANLSPRPIARWKFFDDNTFFIACRFPGCSCDHVAACCDIFECHRYAAKAPLEPYVVKPLIPQAIAHEQVDAAKHIAATIDIDRAAQHIHTLPTVRHPGGFPFPLAGPRSNEGPSYRQIRPVAPSTSCVGRPLVETSIGSTNGRLSLGPYNENAEVAARFRPVIIPFSRPETTPETEFYVNHEFERPAPPVFAVPPPSPQPVPAPDVDQLDNESPPDSPPLPVTSGEFQLFFDTEVDELEPMDLSYLQTAPVSDGSPESVQALHDWWVNIHVYNPGSPTLDDSLLPVDSDAEPQMGLVDRPRIRRMNAGGQLDPTIHYNCTPERQPAGFRLQGDVVIYQYTDGTEHFTLSTPLGLRRFVIHNATRRSCFYYNQGIYLYSQPSEDWFPVNAADLVNNVPPATSLQPVLVSVAQILFSWLVLRELPSLHWPALNLDAYGALDPRRHFDSRCVVQSAISGASGEAEQKTELIVNDAEDVPVLGASDSAVSSFHRAVGTVPIEHNPIFDRFYLVHNTGSWNVSHSRYTRVLQLDAIPLLKSAVRAPWGIIRSHAFFKTDFEFEIRMNNCPFNAGILIFTWQPAEVSTFGVGSLVNFPHTFLRAGDEHIAKLHCPWWSIYRSLSTRSPLSCGTLNAHVWSPLTAGTGTPSTVSFSVWMKPVNTQVSLKAIVQSGRNQHSKVLGNILDTVGSLDLPGISTAAKVSKGIMGYFDAPTVALSRVESSLQADTPFLGNKTALRDTDQVSDDPHFGQPLIHDLIARAKLPCLADAFPWSTTAAASTLLFTIPLTPWWSQIIQETTVIRYVHPTNLAGVLANYQLWRGSLQVTLEVVGTRFHQGQLFVVWDPFNITTATFDQSTNLPATSITIGQNATRTTLTIPYVDQRDWRETCITGDFPDLRSVAGSLRIYVQNPLTAPSNVSSSVEVLVYYAAGDDFEVALPLQARNIHHHMDGSWVVQMFSALTDTATDSFTPLDVTERTPLNRPITTADHSDVRTFLRKPQRIGYVTLAAGYANYANMMAVSPIPYHSWCVHYLGAWMYWTGSVRWMFVTDATNSAPVIFAASSRPNSGAFRTGFPVDVTIPVNRVNTATTGLHATIGEPCAAFVHTQLSAVPFRPTTTTVATSWRESVGEIFFYYSKPVTTNSIHVDIYWSVCDDFCLHVPLPFPPIGLPIPVLRRAEEEEEEPVASSVSVLRRRFEGYDEVDGVDDELSNLQIDDHCVVQMGYLNRLPLPAGSPCVTRRPITASGNTTSVDTTTCSQESSDSDLSDSDDDDSNRLNCAVRAARRLTFAHLRPRRLSHVATVLPTRLSAGISVNAKIPKELRVDFAAIPQFGGVQEMVSKLVNLIRSVYNTVIQLPAAVATFTAAAKAMSDVSSFVAQIPALLTTVLDDVLPAVTAAHTFFYGDPGLKALAVASLVRIIYKNTPQTNKLEEFVAPRRRLDMSGVEIIQGPSIFQTAKDTVRSTVTAAADKITVESVTNVAEAVFTDEVTGPENHSHLIENFACAWISRLLKPFGFSLPNGYRRYIHRVCGDKQVDFAYWFRTVWHTILYLIQGDTINQEWERSQIAAAVATINEFDSKNAAGFFQLDKINDAYQGTTYYGHLQRLYERALVIRSLASEVVFPAFIGQGCQRIIDLYSSKRKLNEFRTTQPEPTAIFLGGTPGCGKSLLLSTYLPTVLLRMAGKRGDPDTEVYSIPLGKQEFWDGYGGQPYVILDEMLQERDGEDPSLIIRAINSIRMPVNAAHLNDKGEVFRSAYFAVSSNSKSVQQAYHTITCPGAIVRRFPFSYSLTVTDEFAAPRASERDDIRLDVTKLNKALKDANYDVKVLDRVWLFTELDMFTGADVKIGETITFSKVVQAMHEKREERIVNHAEILHTCKEIASKIVIQAGRGEPMSGLNSPCDSDDEEDFVTPPSSGYGAALLSLHDSFKEDASVSPQEADIIIEIVRAYNSDELGCDADLLKRSLHPGSSTPFQRAFGAESSLTPQTMSMQLSVAEAFDYVWSRSHYCKSNPVSLAPYKGILRMLVIAGLAGTALYAIVQVVATMLRSGLEIVQAYTNVSTSKISRPIIKAHSAKAIPQCGASEAAERIRRNVRELTCKCSETSLSGFVQTIALDNKTILFPWHFYEHHRNNINSGHTSLCFVSVASADHTVEQATAVHLSPANVQRVSYGNHSLDLGIAHLTTEFIPRAKSIWHLLMREGDAGIVDSSRPASLLNHKCRVAPSEDLPCTVGAWTAAGYQPKSVFVRAVGITSTKLGDCGLPYVMSGPTFPRPLIGIHCYLSEGHAGLAPLFYGAIKEAHDKLGVISVPTETEEIQVQYGPVQPHQQRYWNTEMTLLGEGRFGNFQLKYFTPSDTKYVRVRHRGVLLQDSTWECDFEPAAQKPVAGVHPLFTNAQKYISRALSSVPTEMYRHCVAHYVTKLEKFEGDAKLGWFETINGWENLQPLMLNTSSGFWTALGFKDGKHQFFEPLPQEYDGATGELLPLTYEFSSKAKNFVVPMFNKSFVDRLEEADALARQGITPYTVWVSTVKDELRKKSKVETGNSRVFEQCGLDMTMLLRRYFGKFLSWFRSHYGFTLHSGIGADKEAVWGEYAKGFLANSPRFYCADYTNWDGGMGHHAFQFFLDITDAYYGDIGSDDCKARHALVDGICNANHIAGDTFFESHQGNKSGNPFTDVLNTIGNTLITYLWYLLLMRAKMAKPTLANFDAEVKFLTYGDDVIATIRPDLLQYLSGPKIQEVLLALGYRVTSALKSQTMEESLSLEEASFLKSGFRYDQGVWLAPMEKPAIYKEGRYRPKKFDGDEDDLRMRLQVMQRFLAHHGRDDLKLFQHSLIAKGIPPTWVSLSYGEVIADIRMKQAVTGIY